jgi:23S rRNA (uracil1939-C5)-methyltransferase
VTGAGGARAGTADGAAPEAAAEAAIVRLAPSGLGVAADGRRAAFALPGERVLLTDEDEDRGGAAAVAAILEASPERRAPPCPHFGACGGCALQHASDAFLARWKTEVVVAALAARGLATAVRPPHLSPPGARRRAVFAGRRTRKGAVVGFRAARSHEIVAVTVCPVSRPELVAARPLLEALTRLGASRSGAVRLAVTLSEGGLDLAATDAKPLDAALAASLGRLAEDHDVDTAPVARSTPPSGTR